VDATSAYHIYAQHIAAAHSITGINLAVVAALATDDLVLGATIIGIERVSTTLAVEDRVARAMLVKPPRIVPGRVPALALLCVTT
jgi:hypothetical protein